MKTIELTQGKVAIVDDDRYDALMKFTWRAVRNHRSFYAKTTIFKNGNRIDLSMHRFVARTKRPLVCHHRDLNPLNNRHSNLNNMTKAHHARLHQLDTLLIKYADVTANPGQLLDLNDNSQER